MFLAALTRRNRPFLEAAIMLHQAGEIPANSTVLDLDAMGANAAVMARQAALLGLEVLAMTKQFGRNPPAMDALREGGITSFVAVDMACARAIRDAGHKVGHIGHLSQVPRAEAAHAARMVPSAWTVFNAEKAREAAAAAAAEGRVQGLLARIVAPGDRFYPGHEGGFAAADVESVADVLDALPGGRFAGLTTFPALLFDEARGEVLATPNLATIAGAAARLAKAGRGAVVVNAPGTTGSTVMAALADAGATQVEPGHGLTGTTPLHAVRELPETPAIAYLTEVSHIHQGTAFCFGGGLYVDPVFKDYPVKALVGRDPEAAFGHLVAAEIPPPAMIDYYGKLHPEPGRTVEVGDSVVFGFRPQAFVTRAFIVPIAGIAAGRPQVRGIWTPAGRAAVFG